MGRPRLPQPIAEVTAAAIKNPQRFRDRKEPETGPLGAPPAHLPMAVQECWNLFARELPWLTDADRAIVEGASHLRHRMMSDPECPVAVFTQLRLIMQALGGTPTTRTKIGAGDEDGDDPADQFFN
jgi:hypothetical protein